MMPVNRCLFVILALLATGCAGTNSGQQPTAKPSGSGQVDEARLQRFFALMDEDGDGIISRPEFQSGKGAVFMAIDADGSLTLTQNETRLTPEGFALLAGADGVVDGEEFLGAKVAEFDSIDRNGDLGIPYEELRDYLAQYE